MDDPIEHVEGQLPLWEGEPYRATGLFQSIPTPPWPEGVSVGWDEDPAQQARMGLNYIMGRFGADTVAKSYWVTPPGQEEKP